MPYSDGTTRRRVTASEKRHGKDIQGHHEKIPTEPPASEQRSAQPTTYEKKCRNYAYMIKQHKRMQQANTLKTHVTRSPPNKLFQGHDSHPSN